MVTTQRLTIFLDVVPQGDNHQMPPNSMGHHDLLEQSKKVRDEAAEFSIEETQRAIKKIENK